MSRRGLVMPVERSEPTAKLVVPYGQEFWHQSTAESAPCVPAGGSGEQSTGGLQIGEAISRVSHAFRATPGSLEAQVDADTYRVRLLADGFEFSPHLGGVLPGREAGVPGNCEQSDSAVTVNFRTLAIRRGKTLISDAQSETRSWSVVGNTAQMPLDAAGNVVEHIEARRDGVEVTWYLPRPLAGHGDLEIEAQLQGVSFATQTSSGQHFADDQGIARVRVGEVVVVDAAGRRLLAHVDASQDRLWATVPETFLASATYPVAIDPTMGAEFDIDLPIQAPLSQAAPDVAWNGSNYLVIWEDARNGSQLIYATRVSSSGAVLDPSGIAIGLPGEPAFQPAVKSIECRRSRRQNAASPARCGKRKNHPAQGGVRLAGDNSDNVLRSRRDPRLHARRCRSASAAPPLARRCPPHARAGLQIGRAHV